MDRYLCTYRVEKQCVKYIYSLTIGADFVPLVPRSAPIENTNV